MASATDHSHPDAKGGDDSGLPSGSRPSALNPPVFIASAVIIVAFTLWAWLAPSQAETVIFGSLAWISESLGWYYILTAGLVVLFVLIVAFSHVGRTKMGPDHSTPKFNLFTWTAMLFAAGIGVDLMFYAVAGPATNYLTPPEVAAESMEAARQAPLWTLFHYGIPGWAMYALMGMAFGLFAYRYHLPLSIRSALYPIIGKRAHGATGHTVETAAVIGTIFGIATSLGIGVVFLNFGLNYLFGIPQGTATQVGLILLAVVITTFSTISGVEKGIRRLAELNVVLAAVLLLYVLIAGDTQHLLNALVMNVGDFFSRFPSMMLNTFAYGDAEAHTWLADWTLFFWAWWIAWAPFIGLFLARISRGRTLRQFVVGTLIIPFGFILLWISIFGNGAITEFIAGDDAFLDAAVNTPASGYYMLMEQYPGATFTIGLSVLTGLLFYVTSADSGALVMANFTSKPESTTDDGAPWLRIFWAFATGALTLVMLFIEGIYTLQAATVIIGLPFSIVIYLVMMGIWKALQMEHHAAASHEAAMPWMLTGRTPDASGAGWRSRLSRHMNYPTARQATRFMEETGMPAVEEVAAELVEQGADVTCTRGVLDGVGIPHVDLHVRFGDQSEFKYQAYPVAYSVPNFAQNMRAVEDVYYRVEIFSATGSRGHDIMGYTKEQIISDVLDAYERHLTFLALSEKSGSSAAALATGERIPDEWEHDQTN